MDYTLHVGVKASRLLNFNRALTRHNLRWLTDGDGWETWGEALGTDVNDDETLHVQVIVPAGFEARTGLDLAALIQDVHGDLTPMTAEHQHGIIASLSDSDTWDSFMGGPEVTFR